MQLNEPTAPAEPIVILGAGVTGLAASIASGAPVYEADDTVGGIAASDTSDGFTFDRGIHILQAPSPRVLHLLQDCGVRMNEHSRKAFIHSHGTYSAYPFQVNTAGLPLGLRFRCVRDFLLRPRDASPANYEEWIHASIGKTFAETFLVPYSEKFWTVHPREMTFEWTGNRVPQPKTRQVLRGAFWSKQTRIGTNVDFRYPVHAAGYGAIAQALAARAGVVHCGHRAVRIDIGRRTVHFDNGKSTAYRQLVSTLPLPELVALCTEVPDAVREAAGRLRTNSILVVNFGIARPRISDWHWAHFPERDVSFFRISFPHNFADNVAPPGMSSISTEVAYSPSRPLDRSGIVDRVAEDLVRVGVLRRDDPIVHRSTYDIRYAYCIHDFARKASVRTVRDWMLSRDVIPTGRYGLWNYFWSHEAITSGLQAGERARRGSRPDMVEGETLAAE